jgi:hypothetical protein
MKKALRPEPEGLFASLSERHFARFGTRFGGRRRDRRLRLRAAEPADGVGANAPEDGDLRGLGLLGFAILALVFRTDEDAVHEDVVALVEGVGNGLAEAVEGHNAVPLGFRLPLVVRVLPRLLRGDGQHGEVRAVAADLPLLRVFPEEADELDVIEIHDLFLLFLPHFLGAPEGGVDTAPKASGCILGGTQRIHREEPGKQKTRRCRALELSRSRAQGNERQKKTNVRQFSDRLVRTAGGRGTAMTSN